MSDSTIPVKIDRYAPPLSAWRETTVLYLGFALFVGMLVVMGWLGLKLTPDGFLQVSYFVFFGLLIIAMLCALFGEWRYRYHGRQKCVLLADDEGLWPAHLDRSEALVRWSAVEDAQYEINTTHGALSLLGRHQELLQIDRRLTGYEQLCERVFISMQRPLPELPQTYRAGWRWMEAVFVVLAVYVVWVGVSGALKETILPLILLGMCMQATYSNPVKLTLDAQGITLTYHRFRKPLHYLWDEIENVE